MDKHVIVPIVTLDQPTKSGRIYTKEAITEALKDFHNRDQPTLVDMGTSRTIELEKVCGEIEEFGVVDNKLMAKIKILKTPMGEVFSSIGADNMAYSLKGTCKIDENKVVTDINIVSISVIPKI